MQTSNNPIRATERATEAMFEGVQQEVLMKGPGFQS
jgi:hypothetical protein